MDSTNDEDCAMEDGYDEEDNSTDHYIIQKWNKIIIVTIVTIVTRPN